MADVAQLQQLIEPVVTDAGYALVRIAIIGGKNMTLQIMAEDPATGQMTIDQCARLSRRISALLDETDPIESEYSLEVSSPGIDRPLTRLHDFTQWAGHRARVELAEAIAMGGANRKRFDGQLLGTEGEDIRIDADGVGAIALPFAAIGAAKLVLTDALIAATQPVDAQGADEPGTNDEVDGSPSVQ